MPVALLKPARRISWAWLLPLGALIVAAWLAYQAWFLRGPIITVQIDNGHGIKTGDDVRYRGISVGRIESVSLMPDLQGVLVRARLNPQSEHLARQGSRFWVVRPQLHLTRVEGLETLIGPRFLAALPANAQAAQSLRKQRYFIALTQPPVVESTGPGDLEIILQSPQRGSLHAGAPVSYRQTRVGTVLSVGLNADASAVEARIHIQQPYVTLVRPNTRFWDVGGLQAKLGLTGFSVEIDSADALLNGGVALATPAPAEAGGEIVRTGHRFLMSSKPEEDWFKWQPMVAIGSSLLPPGAVPPSPLRASIGWKEGRWIKGQRSRSGWLLKTRAGLLGPVDLLKPDDKADPDSVVLEVGGAIVPLQDPLAWERNGLGVRPAALDGATWPDSLHRKPTEPEDCLLIADVAEEPLPLAASRLTPLPDGRWAIDPAISLHQAWHGACAVSRRDGALLGMLLLTDDSPVIAFVEPAQAQASSR